MAKRSSTPALTQTPIAQHEIRIALLLVSKMTVGQQLTFGPVAVEKIAADAHRVTAGKKTYQALSADHAAMIMAAGR